MLSKERIVGALGARAADFCVRVVGTTDSTNAQARRFLLDGGVPDRPTVIAAETQSGGRGRLGRSFFSPAGGVYFSLLYEAPENLRGAVAVTSAAAVAVRRAIIGVCGRSTEIKWVNDLVSDGKKVCGILAESVFVGERRAIILGIGINLCPTEFPPELRERAGTLGCTEDLREPLVARILSELYPYLQNPEDRGWLEEYREHSCVIGKEIVWTRGEESGTGVAVGIDRDGALDVRSPDGAAVRLSAGEISLRVISR